MANFLKSLFVKGVEIDPAGATSNQVLKYNGTKFVPGTASTVGSIDDLSDVVISTPSNSQILQFNGTNWVNSAGTAGPTGATGATGSTGTTGATGVAIQSSAPASTSVLWADTSVTGVGVVPVGGATGQVLAKATSADYDAVWATPVTSSDLALKANLASPTLTGVPAAPTATAGTDTTQLATTAFANTAGGLVFVSGATFSGVSSFDVTGFTSTYLFYELRINVFGSVHDSVVGVLYSGATPRNSNYYGSIWYTNYLGSSGVYGTRNNGSSFYLGDVGTNPPSLYTAQITGISNSAFNIVTRGFETNGTATLTGGFSNYAATNSYDKIRFSTNGGANLGGSWTLMGVRKS